MMCLYSGLNKHLFGHHKQLEMFQRQTERTDRCFSPSVFLHHTSWGGLDSPDSIHANQFKIKAHRKGTINSPKCLRVSVERLTQTETVSIRSSSVFGPKHSILRLNGDKMAKTVISDAFSCFYLSKAPLVSQSTPCSLHTWGSCLIDSSFEQIRASKPLLKPKTASSYRSLTGSQAPHFIHFIRGDWDISRLLSEKLLLAHTVLLIFLLPSKSQHK